MKGKAKGLLFVIIFLSLAGAFVSFLLAQEYYFGDIFRKSGDKLGVLSELSNSYCGGGSSFFNCEKVSSSQYSNIFNIPLAIYGLFYFSIAAIFTSAIFITREQLRKLLTINLFWLFLFGSIYSLLLFFISIFKIKAICSLCLVTYIINWTSLILLLVFLLKNDVNPVKSSGLLKKALSEHKKVLLTRYVPAAFLIIIIAAGSAYAINSSQYSDRKKYFTKYLEDAFKGILKQFVRTSPVDVNPSMISIIGKKDAPVTIVEFSDFLCPFCSETARVLDSLIHENPDKVKVVFMNYPLDQTCNSSMRRQLHDGACLLAKGAIAASKQDKFEEYHNLAFQPGVKKVNIRHIENIARKMDIGFNQFMKDLSSPEVEKELQSQLGRAVDLRITSTPTLFINGKRYKFKRVKELLQKIIDQEFNRIQKSSSN